MNRRAKKNDSVELEIVIEELVLDGWPSGHRDRIAQAFRQELVRLLARRIPEALANGTSGPGRDGVLDGGDFAASRVPESVGAAVAQRVFDVLGELDHSMMPGRTGTTPSARPVP